MRKIPDLNAALVYAQVAKAGSFSAAARQLSMPVSTVSDRVAAFEAELGVQLLARTTRQVRLTDAGRELLSRIEPALGAIVSAAEAAASQHATPSGTLRISAPADFSLEPLAKAIVEYRRKFPLVSVTFELTNRYVDLLREGYDLAIRGGDLPDSSHIVKRVGGGRLILVASPGHLRERGPVRRIEDVTERPCIEFSNGANTNTKIVWELRSTDGRRARLHPMRSVSFNSFGLVIEAARQGYGLAFIPEALITRELASGRLERVLPGWSSKIIFVHLMYPAHHEQTPKLKEMVTILCKHLEGVFVARP